MVLNLLNIHCFGEHSQHNHGVDLSLPVEIILHHHILPGAGLMVRVVGLGSEDPEFKSHTALELIADGVDSACHPSEVAK